MPHVYEGNPDGRQSADENLPVSRFRPRYRALSDADKAFHDELKEAYTGVEKMISILNDGRYKSLALTALEESCMWAIKELTA